MIFSPIEKGFEELIINLLDSDQELNENIIGKIQIPIVNFKDQHIHEEWYDLKDETGRETNGRVHLSVQWIHSKVYFFWFI